MGSDLTASDLATLRRLLAAATPGPWATERDEVMPFATLTVADGVLADVYCTDNAALIAALVNAAPALIEMAERAVRDPSAGHPATCRCTACFPG